MGPELGSARAKGINALEFEREVIDPAVPPGFAWLEAADEDVFGIGQMVVTGVMVFGLIAAADMAAGGTHPKVNPGRADSQTVLTAL